ncbi:MAG: uroporphyrinogen-III synthase [Bacteroidales bacterium]|nr:uroporphyrinogen-III synthase [Bacteroidales bacterium]
MSVKKILISQTAPSNTAPYDNLKTKFGVDIEFFPFFKTEALSFREFRAQRVNLSEYTAVIFSSRVAIDAYFALCEEARFKVPETMKYFCTTELVANYLQKHIVFRKRKIFSGDGTPESIMKLIGSKHQGERFLIATSDASNAAGYMGLFDNAGIDYTVAELVKSVYQDLTSLDLAAFDVVVLYNHSDVESLFHSYPEFKQGDIRIISYGKNVVKCIEEAGLKIALQAPTPQAPSVAKALELFLEDSE